MIICAFVRRKTARRKELPVKQADLHLHTRFSDGTYTPEELVAQAKLHQLDAIALTDHDTVAGCARAAAACAAAGIEFVPGSELTSEQDDVEVHMLAYFLDTSDAGLLAELKRFQTIRQERIHKMCAKLNELGLDLQPQDVFAIASCESPGRPHVARALIAKKLCRSFDEAFDRFLKKDRPAHVPKCKMSAVSAINLIHRAGGLAVMAHPALNRTDEIIPALVEAGLDGIEVFHTKHNAAANRRYMDIASKSGLLVTGGSDCHGMSKGRPLIGTVKLGYEHFEKLKAAHQGRAAQK
jgi:predicted metal-dependent phosphoesterase TrpH